MTESQSIGYPHCRWLLRPTTYGMNRLTSGKRLSASQDLGRPEFQFDLDSEELILSVELSDGLISQMRLTPEMCVYVAALVDAMKNKSGGGKLSRSNVADSENHE